MSDIAFYDNEFQQVLAEEGIRTFDGFWDLPRDWVDAINERRGGWSGVTRHVFTTGTGTSIPVYLKRQENQSRRGPLSTYIKKPTFWFEREILHYLKGKGNFGPDLLCYAERDLGGNQQTILVTRSLENYLSIDELLADLEDEQRVDIMDRVGKFLSRLHLLRVEHGAVYEKHIYVDTSSGDCRLIDFERARFRRSSRVAMTKDLERLFRRAEELTDTDRNVILNQYSLHKEFQGAAI
jgi:tRNA A-37 threonylcarbamoyl transferase component Bud32